MADPMERRADLKRKITFNRRFARKLGLPQERLGDADALQVSFEEFREIADASDLPVCIISLSSLTYNYVNQAEARLFGYDHPSEVIGQSLLFNAGYEGEKPEAAMGKLLDTGSTSEKTIVRPDGEVRDLRGTFYAATEELDQYGLPAEFVGFDEDQTAKKQQEEMFQRLSEFTYDWIFWLSPEAEIIYASPSSERITGYTDKEWQQGAIRLDRFVVPEDGAALAAALDSAVRLGEMGKAQMRVETRHAGRRWMEGAFVPVYSKDGAFLGSRVSALDITENKELQEKLVRAERLAVLGELAGSVSHELRNPLNVVKTSSFYLRSRLGETDEKVARHLDRVDRSVERADRTIGDLLAFSRLAPSRFEPTQLADMAGRVVAETTLPSDVSIRLNAEESLPEVRADQVQMEQVLHNLVLNSLQAMNGSGNIDICITREGSELMLVVKDDGAGIAPEDLSKVFEPLFTTKAEGTGFGLAVCKRVVEEHGGTIELSSEPGVGTEAVVRLPITE